MKRLIRENFWWPSLDRLVERMVRECPECFNSDRMLKVHSAPLRPVEWPDFAWQKIAFDISGPFNQLPQNARYALVIIDYHSKWPEVKFVANATTRVIISFIKEVFAREGAPEILVTDNGTQLVSREMESFLRESGIKHMTTSLYEPRENGQVEIFNRVLKESVLCANKSTDAWKEVVRKKLWMYRITPHSALLNSLKEKRTHLRGLPLVDQESKQK